MFGFSRIPAMYSMSRSQLIFAAGIGSAELMKAILKLRNSFGPSSCGMPRTLQCRAVASGSAKSLRRSAGAPSVIRLSSSEFAVSRRNCSNPGALGVIAFITALRSPASAMFPMLLTTSGGTVSAFRRGAPAAAVSFMEKRRSSSTCVHSAYEETSQASAPVMVRTLRIGSRVRNSATASGIRSPRAENGTSSRTVAVIRRGSHQG
ncbi:Uncharacterised protein [Mycobacterium tuberculosis]|nr:Uncharacterised protein [Mycobacterium tuberculosis]